MESLRVWRYGRNSSLWNLTPKALNQLELCWAKIGDGDIWPDLRGGGAEAFDFLRLNICTYHARIDSDITKLFRDVLGEVGPFAWCTEVDSDGICIRNQAFLDSSFLTNPSSYWLSMGGPFPERYRITLHTAS